MKTSQLFSLNTRDFINGLIMAAGGGALSVIVNAVNADHWVFSLTALWHGAVVGAIPYLVKNFATPADPTKIVTKDGDGTVTETKITTDQVDVVVPGK